MPATDRLQVLIQPVIEEIVRTGQLFHVIHLIRDGVVKSLVAKGLTVEQRAALLGMSWRTILRATPVKEHPAQRIADFVRERGSVTLRGVYAYARRVVPDAVDNIPALIEAWTMTGFVTVDGDTITYQEASCHPPASGPSSAS